MTEHKIQERTNSLHQAFDLAERHPGEMVVLVSARNASRIIVGGNAPQPSSERQKDEYRLEV